MANHNRKFDHDRCRTMYATGNWTQTALGEFFGVTPAAVARVVNPDLAKRMAKRSSEYVQAICDDCGGPCVHNFYAKGKPHDSILCKPCRSARIREDCLLAHLDDDGDIRCNQCGEYKHWSQYKLRDDGTPQQYDCKPCRAAARRDYRRRHPEEERIRSRDYARARRARLRLVEDDAA